MKANARLKTILQEAEAFWNFPQTEAYPEDMVDLVIFHKLHFYMPPPKAWKCYQLLKSEFVDWNEVRISVVREIQEHLATARNSLEISVFVKDFLEFIHKECRRMSLEHLLEENLSDIRKFLKAVRAIEPATIDLVLQRRRNHPVFPLSQAMEDLLTQAGIVSDEDSRDRKSKRFFEMVGADNITACHHYMLHCLHAEPNDKGNAFEGPPASLRTGRARKAAKTGAKGKKTAKSTKTAKTKKTKKSTGAASKKKTTNKKKAGAKKSARS